MKKLLLAVAVLGLGSSVAAYADPIGTTETFHLTVDGCTGGCGSGATDFGTITLTQTAVGVVTVTETLAKFLPPKTAEGFVDTGAGQSLTFSLAGDPTITIGSLTTGFRIADSTKDSPFADGDYAITCAGVKVKGKITGGSCGPGASVTNAGPLSFTVTDAAGVNVSNFAALGCYKPAGATTCENIFFSSDIIGPTGKTGDVGALGSTIVYPPPPPTVTPEPSSLALLGSGVLGLAGVVRRKFRKA